MNSRIELKILLTILGLILFILLFPSLSGLAIFSKGEFDYPQSIGIIFIPLFLLALSVNLSYRPLAKFAAARKIPALILPSATVAFSVLFILTTISLVWIRHDVRVGCRQAIGDYGGNCSEALIAQLSDDSRPFYSRNQAVWLMGQLADPQFLPILETYYTGQIFTLEPLNSGLSQYELEKAIRWCRQGNITSWMYGRN